MFQSLALQTLKAMKEAGIGNAALESDSGSAS